MENNILTYHAVDMEVEEDDPAVQQKIINEGMLRCQCLGGFVAPDYSRIQDMEEEQPVPL